MKEIRPGAYISGIGFAYAETVSYPSKNVQFRRHAGSFHLQVKLWQVFGDILAIIRITDEKCRGSLLREMQVVRNCRIEKRLKRRSRTLSIDGISRRLIARVETIASQRCQFSSRGKSDYADAVWMDAPLRCATAYETESALDILQLSAFDGISGTGLAREPVLKHKGRDAMAIQPFCNCIAS